MSKNNGGPAFPGLHPSKECTYKDSGMTLRDYFAAKAMQTLLSHHLAYQNHFINMDEFDKSDLELHAYYIADAMLVGRENG